MPSRVPAVPLLPLVSPGAPLDGERLARASRTIILPGIDVDGQRRISHARVLVIGAGGLGSPVLQYLAAAGVGVIGIVDFDVVDLSNLQRQVIHQTASLGEAKTSSAARAINALDPGLRIVEHSLRLDSSNALQVFGAYDLVIDGSDNFATRYLCNDTAALLGMPYVWGSVLRFDGQVTVFWEGAPDGRAVDYRDVHPVPPAAGEVLSCDEAGVLGAVCGVIGSMMAVEALKLITGVGTVLLGRIVTFDALAGDWRESRVVRAPGRMPVRELIDYEQFCGAAPSAGPGGDLVGVSAADSVEESAAPARETITATQLARLAASDSAPAILDVREPFEREIVSIPGSVLVPLARLLEDPDAFPHEFEGRGVIVYCKSGARSAQAAVSLRDRGIDAVSLSGGILSWIADVDPSGQRY